MGCRFAFIGRREETEWILMAIFFVITPREMYEIGWNRLFHFIIVHFPVHNQFLSKAKILRFIFSSKQSLTFRFSLRLSMWGYVPQFWQYRIKYLTYTRFVCYYILNLSPKINSNQKLWNVSTHIKKWIFELTWLGNYQLKHKNTPNLCCAVLYVPSGLNKIKTFDRTV